MKKIIRFIPIFILIVLMSASIITGIHAAGSASNPVSGTVVVEPLAS